MLEDLVFEALKEACERAGNQVKLANATGLSQGQISGYLCGSKKIRNMTIATLEKIFPDLLVVFFRDKDGFVTDLVMNEIIEMARSMTPAQRVHCLKIMVANFPDNIIKDMKQPI